MTRTTLRDSHNNKVIKVDENNKITSSDLVDSINFRIKKHREFIKQDYKVIESNIGFSGIINDAVDRITSREDKIRELSEFLDICLPKT